jgi:hypothetical protein
MSVECGEADGGGILRNGLTNSFLMQFIIVL